MLAEPDVTALPFTPADYAALRALHAEMRPRGVAVDIFGSVADHEADADHPDTCEVTFPRGAQPMIMFRRCAAGFVAWECDSHAAGIGRWRRVFPDLAATLADVRAEVDAEEAEAIAAIPERLGVDLSGLFGDGGA